MTEYKIPFIRPSFPTPSAIATDIDEIVKSNWYTNFGPMEMKFSQALEEYVGQGIHATSMANGTLALIAAIECTFGRGDSDRYLLMPSFTFIAVPQAAIWNGYRPWFIDIDPLTWQSSMYSASAILESARDKIAGIVLPNALGVGNPQISAWEAMAAEWGLQVVIDSAAGFGSRYQDGETLGSRGSCEVFSFHATKPFSIGEGGALASRNHDLVERARSFQNFGFDNSRVCIELGLNAKLSEIGAAIGLRQLVDLNRRIESRRKTFEHYRAALSPLGLSFQPNADGSSHQCCSIRSVAVEQKVSIMRSLERHRIQARDYYNPPLHRHAFFSGKEGSCAMTDLSVTEDICSRIVSLPIFDEMSTTDTELVIQAVTDAVTSC